MVLSFLTSILQGIFTVILKTWWVIVPILGVLAYQNTRKAKWAGEQESVLLTIKVPRDNEKDPTAAEMMFATLHGILKPKSEIIKEGSFQEHISFEIEATISAIQFFVWTPVHLKDFVEGQIYAQYPSAEIAVSKDYSKDIDIDDDGIDDHVMGTEISLTKNEIFPIKTFQNFSVDPLAGITGVLSKLEKSDERIWIQILARPVSDEWQNKGLNYISAKKSGKPIAGEKSLGKTIMKAPFKLLGEVIRLATTSEQVKKDPPKLSSNEEGKISAIEEKAAKLGYEVKIRCIYISKSKELARQRLQAVIGTFKQFNSTNLNGFVSSKIQMGSSFLNDYRARLFIDKGFTLNIEELASLYHLPHTSVETPNIKWTSSKTAESPTELPTEVNTSKEELTIFAETNFRHNRTKFGIKTDDRRKHTYIIGKSGMGKSKLMEGFIEEDIQRGNGLAVIDPNGDLIYDVLKKIPDHRIDDVIILDPADHEFPVGFNPLELKDESMKHFVAQGFVKTMEKMFGHSWGPRLEYILNYTVLALLEYPDRTVLGIVRMLTDKDFRKKVVAEVKDPVVKKFWNVEFATYNDRFASEAVAPILNKVGQFTASSLIRNMIGQPKGAFDLREAMDSKKIILINLSTGRLGEVNSGLMGGMIITKLQLAAMSRADTKPEDRVDFFLYVDEFQHFATESFATILSEARKYKLSLTIANQYIAQMDEKVREAVFGNVGTMVAFKVGAVDAGFLEKELNPPFEVNDIINLDRQQIYLKMTIDGQTSNPFSAKTITIPEIDRGNTEKIIARSREKYARPKKEIEDKINEWAGMSESEVAPQNPNSFDKPHKINTYKKPVPNNNNYNSKPYSAPVAPTVNKEQGKYPPRNNSKPYSAPVAPATNKEQGKYPPNNNQSSNNRSAYKATPHTTPHKSTYKESSQTSQGLKSAPQRTNFNKVTPKPVEKPKPSPKERRTVDKESLKAVIKSVVNEKPKENEKPIERTTEAPKRAEEPKRVEKRIEPVKPVNNPQTHTQPEKKEIKPFEDHRSEKEIKIVTPENLKDLKEIHPHQKIEVKADKKEDDKKKDGRKELKPGDTITFDDK